MDSTIGEYFGSLPDDRRDQGKCHLLLDICTIAIAAGGLIVPGAGIVQFFVGLQYLF